MIPNPANYSAISFPLLGIEVDPIRTISLGPLTIHLYGAVIALGLLLAGIYCSHRSKRAGLTEDDILDGILWIAPFAVLCARAYYCVFSWSEYAENPISVLYIWNGGLGVTLFELSNTNKGLLRNLSEIAPGTFQHSITVGNLAAEIARLINLFIIISIKIIINFYGIFP